MALADAAEDIRSESDATLVARARTRDEASVRELTRRYNRRLFRIARSILQSDAEAEDVVQEAYVRAFTGLDGFRGDALFGTWVTRIALNEALGRRRSRRPTVEWSADSEPMLRPSVTTLPSASTPIDPERTMADREIRELVERSIDTLPDAFRLAFVARVVEGMTLDETAALLGVRPETVKTRVHRARRRLRDEIERRIGGDVRQAFAFDGARCERLTEAVIGRLAFSSER
jgi:RNA polymerase sigma-70 factor (ECF subfamily)